LSPQHGLLPAARTSAIGAAGSLPGALALWVLGDRLVLGRVPKVRRPSSSRRGGREVAPAMASTSTNDKATTTRL
jgi:hypothetical protein